MGFDHFGTAKIISGTTDIKILTKMQISSILETGDRPGSKMSGFSYFHDFLCENKLLVTNKILATIVLQLFFDLYT